MIKPINRNKLFQDISDQIIDMVKNNIWSPGDKIPGEIELAESFSVSRNILREALKSLELSGILEAKAGKGTFLTKDALVNIKKMELFNTLKEENTISELMETRLIIEPSLAKLATVNATDEEIKKIGKYCVNKEQYTINMGVKFHMSIVQLSGNKILYTLLSSIIDEIEAQRFMYIEAYSKDENLECSIKEHKKIYEALKDRDGELIYKLVHKHIEDQM
ncbi:MAG: FadR/GntR family transcriptional regulator [Paraclostridium sp.]